MKIVTIVGARPQFIKASLFSKEFRKKNTEILINTGQHYDVNMVDIFFNELDIPKPDYNLSVGSGLHGHQTSEMLTKIEKILIHENPKSVLVYGDTNSTLAGSLAASKLNIPIIHIEAGLRSFNRKMPEEVNRIITDHVSALLLCPSVAAVQNLEKEGINEGVFNVGDIMLDSLAAAFEKSKLSTILEENNLVEKKYILLTLHRAENTDDLQRLKNIFETLTLVEEKIICPLHPRTKKALNDFNMFDSLSKNKNLHFIEPLGYINLVRLVSSSKLVLTDSGGLQKEAYWLKIPCITLREETEWVETVESGWNKVVGVDPIKILYEIKNYSEPDDYNAYYGKYGVVKKCSEIIESFITNI